ncbi:DUF3152 domain-containing protein [Streptomyces sp. RerS4]|uniref:DUF3152 domain-containing protein n=1 Tax=Streptomyces sp. RerS4 TaxID=2942449 RepID=UPI00201BAA00|nr:DUF3152 domain-containing protein [Streptomyces sp. RerS4]UQX02868.1 DUF3152 domain-containing protein [Streptomyces sp. RerS4]
MGRHSRKDPAPVRPVPEAAPYEPAHRSAAAYEGGPYDGALYEPAPYEDGYHEPYAAAAYQGGYDERPAPYQDGSYEPQSYEPQSYEPQPHEPQPHEPRPYEAAYGQRPRPRATEPPVVHRGHVVPSSPARPGGHPEQWEGGGAWGANALHRPAAPLPRITVEPAPPAPAPASDPLTGTGSHRRVPGPRTPEVIPDEPPVTGRGTKIRTYTGMAAAAVTTVLAVVVAGQVATEQETTAGAAPAVGKDETGRALGGQSAASRSDGRPTPASPPPAVAQEPPTYEQQMARQLPIDAKLAGPGTFDTVPGIAKAPGKGRLIRYRVDVEQGLGLDAQLFAEAVQRTLNDPRSWAHGGAMTFERVPSGEADFVITLASPGTTGTWCARSGLDTTVDNVSCDSAATERVMINAFRWAQGSTTYGPDRMLAYRQMIINHEVGHRLGHGHVSCRTPGALAPIMQQQTKSLDIDNISCKPNPWVYPGN